MTERNHAELEAWLLTDRRHRGGLLRAQAALHAMEVAVARGPSVLSSDNDDDYGRAAGPDARRRRPGLGAIAAIAACLLALIAVGPVRFLSNTTGPAADEVLDLADGSVVTLLAGARIAVEMTDTARAVTLESSKAIFDVAKDPDRPFVVRSGEVFAQAVGTVYSVARVGARGASVSVSEGSVLVWADGQPDQGIVLGAGDKVTLDPDARMPPVSSYGLISLDNESILSVAKRFNRVNRKQIIVDDVVIGDVRVVGLFKINDPEQFAEAAARVANARVIHRGDHIIIEPLEPAVIKN